MTSKSHTVDKIYYSISEVAAMFGVNASLIRFWEKEFDVLQPIRNRKGNRLFARADLENLQIIYHLVRERGFTLEGARKHLKQHRNETLPIAQVSHSLQKIRETLLEIDRTLSGEVKQQNACPGECNDE
ncbi:MAG TPA: MerR family transcriptional regulator [Bacteroidales bacterium]|nr:MerR family transcriptional regulator [Bacteroidales bacterium]HNS47587.1 MerR family transcriptional regulator [Bacteroidales bacterium]